MRGECVKRSNPIVPQLGQQGEVHEDEPNLKPPSKATDADPGSQEKIRILRERVERNEWLWHDDDRSELSCRWANLFERESLSSNAHSGDSPLAPRQSDGRRGGRHIHKPAISSQSGVIVGVKPEDRVGTGESGQGPAGQQKLKEEVNRRNFDPSVPTGAENNGSRPSPTLDRGGFSITRRAKWRVGLSDLAPVRVASKAGLGANMDDSMDDAMQLDSLIRGENCSDSKRPPTDKERQMYENHKACLECGAIGPLVFKAFLKQLEQKGVDVSAFSQPNS